MARASGSGPGRTGEAVKSVLLVCHANTCRSVMAHVLLEKMLAERDAGGRVQVRSGGIANHARDGMIPSLDARIVLREDGIHLAEDTMTSTDLRRHRELIADAHLILTMTNQQKEMLGSYDEARGRLVFTLKEFAGEEGDIGDPFNQGEDRYRACRDEIKRCLEKGVDRLILTLSTS
jgi:protein-tyrosine-phosphatase